MLWDGSVLSLNDVECSKQLYVFTILSTLRAGEHWAYNFNFLNFWALVPLQLDSTSPLYLSSWLWNILQGPSITFKEPSEERTSSWAKHLPPALWIKKFWTQTPKKGRNSLNSYPLITSMFRCTSKLYWSFKSWLMARSQFKCSTGRPIISSMFKTIALSSLILLAVCQFPASKIKSRNDIYFTQRQLTWARLYPVKLPPKRSPSQHLPLMLFRRWASPGLK